VARGRQGIATTMSLYVWKEVKGITGAPTEALEQRA
jgi:hypothetical protein